MDILIIMLLTLLPIALLYVKLEFDWKDENENIYWDNDAKH